MYPTNQKTSCFFFRERSYNTKQILNKQTKNFHSKWAYKSKFQKQIKNSNSKHANQHN